MARPGRCNLVRNQGIVLVRAHEDLFRVHRCWRPILYRCRPEDRRDAPREKGHEVLTEHLIHDNAWSQDRLIPAQQVYQRDMKWLEQCDLFLAEVSGSSFGLGFEAGYLLGGSSKRVILFYKREIADKISLLITGNFHPNCILVPLTDVLELEKFVSDHV